MKAWLYVLEEVLRETSNPVWDEVVPTVSDAEGKTPLLADSTVTLEVPLVRRWGFRLMRIARQTPNGVTLKRIESADDFDFLALFRFAVCQEHGPIEEMARSSGADPAALQAVADSIPIPFLQACGRQLNRRVPKNWTEGYCPICGAWPTLAEERGIERIRRLRCGRCGGDWRIDWLRCPYCRTTEHEQLLSLTPQQNRGTRRVDACNRCQRYLKALPTLQANPAAKIALEDLLSADLDLTALRHGYIRPKGPGRCLGLKVLERPTYKRRFLPWCL